MSDDLRADKSEDKGMTDSTTDGKALVEQSKNRIRRGFAGMSRERVREISSKGGKAAHAAGTAHRFTSEEARIAGRKGGLAEGKRQRAETREKIAERESRRSVSEES